MSRSVFELLLRKGFLRRGRVVQERIFRASLGLIVDTAAEVRSLNSTPPPARRDLLSSHTASLALGGGRHYCQSFECRQRKAVELAQFSLMYSDRVYVRSFFADHRYADGKNNPDPDELRSSFEDDLRLLVFLRPVLEEGHLALYAPPDVDCPQCLARETLGLQIDKRITRAYNSLSAKYLTEVEARAGYRDGEYYTGFDGPEYLLGHRGGVSTDGVPDILSKAPQLRARILRGEVVDFSRAARAKLGIHKFLAGSVIESIIFELLATQALGTSFLTDERVHVETLAAITGDDEIARRNQLALKHLTSAVPFLPEVSIQDLVRLRKQEAEAFLVYRHALNNAMKEYKGASRFSERDAKGLYADVVAPRLAALDSRVRSARRTLLKDVRRNVVGWTGAISFGVFSGLLPPALAAAAGSVGLTATAAQLLKDVMTGSDKHDVARTDEMYFLWVVRERGRRKRRPRSSSPR